MASSRIIWAICRRVRFRPGIRRNRAILTRQEAVGVTEITPFPSTAVGYVRLAENHELRAGLLAVQVGMAWSEVPRFPGQTHPSSTTSFSPESGHVVGTADP